MFGLLAVSSSKHNGDKELKKEKKEIFTHKKKEKSIKRLLEPKVVSTPKAQALVK